MNEPTCGHRSNNNITCGEKATTYHDGKWLCALHALAKLNRKRK